MYAVHSFFPIDEQADLSPVLWSWALSMDCAKKYLGPTMLITNPVGQKLLGRLGYDEQLVLNDCVIPDFAKVAPTTLKLLALAAVDRPFVHVDGDAYQWRPLPERMLNAPWFCLLKHFHHNGCDCRRYSQAKYSDAWIQKQFEVRPHRHCCYGLVGGTDWRSWNEAAKFSIPLALEAYHQMKHEDETKTLWTMGQAFEEFVTAEFLWRKLGPAQSLATDWTQEEMLRVGHTHLVGPTKAKPEWIKKVQKKLNVINPKLYRRVAEVLEEQP